MKGIVAVLILAIMISGCATIREYSNIKQGIGIPLEAGIGDIVLKIDRSKDLPNVFNKKDIWGGKVDMGFTELRYQGLNDKGEVVFHRTDVERRSDESVFTRYGIVSGGGNQATAIANNGGSAAAVSVNANAPIKANIEILPPNTKEIVVDLGERKEIVVSNVRVCLIEVDKYTVKYKLEKLY